MKSPSIYTHVIDKQDDMSYIMFVYFMWPKSYL